jgi:hypothetical protein
MDTHGSLVTALSTQPEARACLDTRGGDPAGHVPAHVMDQLAVRIGQALRLDP